MAGTEEKQKREAGARLQVPTQHSAPPCQRRRPAGGGVGVSLSGSRLRQDLSAGTNRPWWRRSDAFCAVAESDVIRSAVTLPVAGERRPQSVVELGGQQGRCSSAKHAKRQTAHDCPHQDGRGNRPHNLRQA